MSRLRRPAALVVDGVALDVVLIALILDVVLPAVITVVVGLTVMDGPAVGDDVGFVDVPVANVAKVVNKTRNKFKISI
jgi:hypothetical protein